MRTLDRWFERQVDARPVAVVRMVVGAAAVIRGLEADRILSRVLDPATARVPYLEAVPALPIEALRLFIVVWCVASVAFALGWRTRLAGFVLSACLGYNLLLDQQTYTNHLYLLTLLVLLLTVADSGARFSLDARLGRGRESVAAWPVLLLKMQLTIVYGFAAITKINTAYVSGAIMSAVMRHDGPLAIPESWHSPALMSLLAMLSILTETFLALALWTRKWRRVAVVVGIGFHASIIASFDPSASVQLTVFALAMLSLYLLFFTFPKAPAVVRVAGEQEGDGDKVGELSLGTPVA